MPPTPVTRLAVVLAVSALAGCDVLDPTETDPNVAHIDAVTLATAPADGGAVFVRLATRFDTTDTEAAPGPFPLALAVPPGFAVTTTDGRFYDGEPLTVEIRRCTETCVTSVSVGRETVAPDAWADAERTVTVAGTAVTLTYRKTSS